MSVISQDAVNEALKDVKYPGFSRDIVSFGLVKEIRTEGVDVDVRVSLATNDPAVPAAIKEAAEARLRAIPGIGRVNLRIDIQAPPAAAAAAGPQQIEGVRNIIAVASGKGGVGKSTVAANLAIALRRGGAKVGLCDCDLYGPSIALMFGSNERPTADEQNRIIPIERYGVRLMSMGFLLDDDSPAVLRGPMVTRYTQQFLRQVDWGDLDFLILDLPPGTGDIQLTIVQTVALAGAIIVTTPQEVALIDARKASRMFSKTNVPVLGLIENMSYFQCPSDGMRYDIFGKGGGAREAARLGVPLLGEIPIEMALREGGDIGRPISEFDPETLSGTVFARIAGMINEKLAVDVSN
ncbi:MAG TPA: Mrp/NBP35 family ATP-binding protein [Chthoniobacterales bacterium]